VAGSDQQGAAPKLPPPPPPPPPPPQPSAAPGIVLRFNKFSTPAVGRRQAR